MQSFSCAGSLEVSLEPLGPGNVLEESLGHLVSYAALDKEAAGCFQAGQLPWPTVAQDLFQQLQAAAPTGSDHLEGQLALV